MKNLKSFLKKALVVSPMIALAACSNNDAKFKNLASEKNVYIIKDSVSGEAIDSITKEPVLFYVNLETKDTIYGKTGEIVNNAIIRTENGAYLLDETKIKMPEAEIKIPSGDVKIKVDGDEIKIKTDEKKIKIDGNERKVKYND